MININVLGCCVSRDTLSLKSDIYNVPRYVAFTSPYSMNNGISVDISTEICEATRITNFCKKMMSLDARKKSIEYLKEVSTEWLLFDIADSRQPIIKFQNNVVLTYNAFVRSIINRIAQQAIFGKAKIVQAEELPKDELLNSLNYLLNAICEVYKPAQIIFHEFYRCDDFICKRGYYKKFNLACVAQNGIWNKLVRELNQFCITHLDGCHVIPAINNVISDENNKWGLSPYHFYKEYYEYAEKSVAIITQKYDRVVEEEKLAALHDLYTEKFNVVRERALHNLTRVDRERLRASSQSFENIISNNLSLHDENGVSYLSNAFLHNGYKHIAIYGYTDITKVLVNVLNGTDVTIDYIVENADRPVQGIKTINRNPADYPNCDLMLVTDIAAYNDIKAKLEKIKVPFPFVNAAEFIQSLPALDNDSVFKVKAKIQELEDELSASATKQAELSAKVDGLMKVNAAANESMAKLTIERNNMAAVRDKLASEKQAIITERDKANVELELIKNSLSFRLGQAATFIPRKLRDVFKRK